MGRGEESSWPKWTVYLFGLPVRVKIHCEPQWQKGSDELHLYLNPDWNWIKVQDCRNGKGTQRWAISILKPNENSEWCVNHRTDHSDRESLRVRESSSPKGVSPWQGQHSVKPSVSALPQRQTDTGGAGCTLIMTFCVSLQFSLNGEIRFYSDSDCKTSNPLTICKVMSNLRMHRSTFFNSDTDTDIHIGLVLSDIEQNWIVLKHLFLF